jgi:outer membrane protein TolC
LFAGTYQAEDAIAQSDKAVAQNLIVLYKALGGGWDETKVSTDAR